MIGHWEGGPKAELLAGSPAIAESRLYGPIKTSLRTEEIPSDLVKTDSGKVS